jgi:hypothetical protein
MGASPGAICHRHATTLAGMRAFERMALAICPGRDYLNASLSLREHAKPGSEPDAAVVVIVRPDGEGASSFDRSRFAPRLTDRLT